MKKFALTMIAIFAVITIGLICLLVSVLCSGGLPFSYSSANATLVNTQNLNMEDISSVTIDYTSEDITFYESDTEELILKEYMSPTPEENELAQITQSGNELRIRSGKRNYRTWFLNNYRRYVEVYLPSDYTGRLSVESSSGNVESDLVLSFSHFEASSTSGDINLNEVSAEDIGISSSSGNITLQMASGEKSISSTSGDIKVHEGAGDINAASSSGNITLEANIGEVEADSSSGDITIKSSSGDKKVGTTSGEIKLINCSGFTDASASSGDIEISDLSGAGDFETTSGNIDVEFTEDAMINEDIKADASSGDVSLILPSSLSFNFIAETSSGDIDTFFDDALSYKQDGDYATGKVGENPVIEVQLNTTSGNIKVND